MVERVYNYLGEDITESYIELLSPDYGYVDSDNNPHINWGGETESCDINGFDKSYRPLNDSDSYIIEDYILPKGTIICRYGFPRGFFTTEKGTSYDLLGLPYVRETIEYHEYKVSEDLRVTCIVRKGVIAPKFQSAGGGIQFMHKQSIRLEMEDGFLKEDKSWIQENI